MPESVGVIVIVEDDDRSRRAFERVLSAAGFRARTFASAEALLESSVAAQAACLVFDIHLPGLSGLELRRALVRSGGNQPPVIFITAQDGAVVRAQAAALGAAAYLAKPFAGRTLVEAVSQAVGGAGRA